MADVEVTPGDAQSPIAAEGERKTKRAGMWVRWAGVAIAGIALIRVITFFLPQGLAECDGSDLQSSLRSAMETTSKLKLTSVTDIKTLTRNSTSATCSMNVKASDGTQAQIAYRLDLIKGETNFKVTEVK
jgi:hypothetical protein